MRQLERLVTYWLIRMVVADVIAVLVLVVAAVAAVRLWRDLASLVRW